jgi:hypothetical protein
LLIVLRPARARQLEALYAGVEAETRRLLATLSPSDLEAVIRFFRTLAAARASAAVTKETSRGVR